MKGYWGFAIACVVTVALALTSMVMQVLIMMGVLR